MLSLLYLGVVLAAGAPIDLQQDGLKALDQQNFQQAQEIFSKLTAADPKDYSPFSIWRWLKSD